MKQNGILKRVFRLAGHCHRLAVASWALCAAGALAGSALCARLWQLLGACAACSWQEAGTLLPTAGLALLGSLCARLAAASVQENLRRAWRACAGPKDMDTAVEKAGGLVAAYLARRLPGCAAAAGALAGLLAALPVWGWRLGGWSLAPAAAEAALWAVRKNARRAGAPLAAESLLERAGIAAFNAVVALCGAAVCGADSAAELLFCGALSAGATAAVCRLARIKRDRRAVRRALEMIDSAFAGPSAAGQNGGHSQKKQEPPRHDGAGLHWAALQRQPAGGRP